MWTFYVAGSVLDAGDIAVHKTDMVSALTEFTNSKSQPSRAQVLSPPHTPEPGDFPFMGFLAFLRSLTHLKI